MKVVAGLLVLGMVGAACSEEETTSTTAAAVETTAAAVETTAAAADELVQWALDYTGGTAGAASGDPITIGYVNSEDYFPENTIGLNAAI